MRPDTSPKRGISLAAVQAIIAVVFLVVGVVALFGVGISGALVLVPGVVFAAIAGVAQNPTRAAVIVALAADAVLAFFAVTRLQTLFNPVTAAGHAGVGAAARLTPSVLDVLVPSAILALVAAAGIAVVLNWRTIRSSAWF